MSILKSMYSAASGLGAHGSAMDVVSDNIANLNTIGFKAGRGRFESVLGGSIASQAVNASAGNGARMAGVQQNFSQGSMLGTGVATDMAIQGDGFFVVDGNHQGVDGQFFTRAGQFNLDSDGYLVDPNGLRVQGYSADPTGEVSSQLGDLTIPPNITVPPQATTTVDIAANLDANATPPPAFDVTDPEGTSNFSSSVVVYDSLGAAHTVNLYFRKTGTGSWDWHALVDGAELSGGTPGVMQQTASGSLTFTTNGELDTETTNASSFDFVDAAPGQSINFDFGDSLTTDGGTGTQGVTSYAGESDVLSLQQDGFATGALADLEVAENGMITGTFTNGEKRPLGQVATARFRNNQGLARAGAGLSVATADSGQALIGTAGSGGRGSIVAESLEQSNVDLAGEFVDMIAYQRGFQANSRAVQTADEMLAELNQIKR